MQRATRGARLVVLLFAASVAMAQLPAVPATSPAAVPAPISPTDPPVAPAVDAVPVAVPATAPVVPVPPDTARAVVGLIPEVSEKTTRPMALRIVGVIVLLTLSTLLLYNVRSR